MASTPLRLIALDLDDLAVMAAHLEGAELSPAEMAWLPAERRFAALARRHVRCGEGAGGRCQTGLHFERVLKVQHQQFDPSDAAPRRLLSLLFEPGPAPAGFVTLVFVDGGAIRLEVECLEAALADLPCEAPGEAEPA